MADRIVRAISTDGMVQAAAIWSGGLAERARQIHKTLPVATAALDGQVFLDETEDTYCVWRTEYHRGLCTYYMDLFRRRGDGAWRRSAEVHRQRAYSVEELAAWLAAAGFGDVRVYGDMRMRRPRADEQRVYISCVRK